MDTDMFVFSFYTILLSLSVLSSSPAILFRCFMLCLCPCSCTLLHSLYFHHFPQPKACPPLTLCLLSVNSLFPFLVCWPHLTYLSLSLFQLSLSHSASPSTFPHPLWETENTCIQYVYTNHDKHTNILCCTCLDRHAHTFIHRTGVSSCFHDNTHVNTQTALFMSSRWSHSKGPTWQKSLIGQTRRRFYLLISFSTEPCSIV